jgi:hypothetical protein
MEEHFKITPGSKVFLGQPKSPAHRLAKKIADQFAVVAEIEEAHFPQCFVPGQMPTPAQVLVIVVGETHDAATCVRRVQERLAAVLLRGQYVDVWALRPSDGMVESVRSADCRILRRAGGRAVVERPWSVWRCLARAVRRA